MAYVSGEVVPNPTGSDPFKVVFRHSSDGKVIAEWPCSSVAEGEKQIVDALQGLKDA